MRSQSPAEILPKAAEQLRRFGAGRAGRWAGLQLLKEAFEPPLLFGIQLHLHTVIMFWNEFLLVL